jgi:hypothetical protein
MQTRDEIRGAALKLPLADRAALVEEIASSLPLPPDVDEFEFARVILQRSGAYDRGETEALDWRESIARMRAALASRIANAAQD